MLVRAKRQLQSLATTGQEQRAAVHIQMDALRLGFQYSFQSIVIIAHIVQWHNAAARIPAFAGDSIHALYQ